MHAKAGMNMYLMELRLNWNAEYTQTCVYYFGFWDEPH
jgi:hypothetical protein